MTAIIEAAARALRDKVGSATFAGRSNLLPLSLDDLAQAVLTAVTPLIEDAYARKLKTAEDIARKGNEYAKGWKLIEDDGSVTTLGADAAAIRAAALEEAAKVAELFLNSADPVAIMNIATAIRARKRHIQY